MISFLNVKNTEVDLRFGEVSRKKDLTDTNKQIHTDNDSSIKWEYYYFMTMLLISLLFIIYLIYLVK